MFCIKSAKNNLNLKGLRALYFALIHSHLSYCPFIISLTTNSNLTRLFKIQKKAIRIITGSKYNEHTLPLFINHKILPLEKIIKQRKLLFMHSVYYRYCPKSFNTTWSRNNERNNDHNLRNNNLFDLTNPRTEFFKKSPLYALPFEWNNSGNLIYYENVVTFKHALRDQLFLELSESN